MEKSNRVIILFALFSLMTFYGNPVHAEEADSQTKVKVTYTVEEQPVSSTKKTSQSDSHAQLTSQNSQSSEENQLTSKEKKDNLKRLPQMNERKRIMGILMGGILLLFLGIIFARKKKEIK